ncbi:MAG: Hsp70 family protein [Defluviitaleaceae bacterium]|nr:Hsp70 family protein [Defluviitaleaceae bacterium]MCL2836302.1 Hsp70 family protein [Defluviitaleaceae bacterium]
MSYLGIDLGTTNSVAIIYKDKTDQLEVVKIDGTDEILPSVVTFAEEGVIVGSEAKSGAIIYPENTVISVKRLMGGTEKLNIGELAKSPEEISAEILRKLKHCAEEQAGEIFDEVVITHPAYFNDRQIFATKQAGALAGFKEVFLLSEPLGAAIEYGFRQAYAQTLLVYDLGGGTFDACVLEVGKDENGQEIFQELSDVGDMNLGGDDFDSELIRWMKEKFKEDTQFDLDDLQEPERKRVLQKLKLEAEQTKKKLSGANKASVRVNPITILDGVPMNLSLEITREEFEAMIRKYVDRSRDIIEEALNRAGKAADEISKVILVGGSTLIPMVRRMVAGFIKEPYRATDPAKSVAMGAAIYNYLIHLPGSNVKVGQITRQIFGTEAVTNVSTKERSLIPIIPMGSPIPSRFSDANFASSGAPVVNVDVFQWESGHEADKKYIGSVVLTGLKGTTQIEITYAIDKNNLFEVYVKDISTGHTERAEFDRTKENAPPKREIGAFGAAVNIVFVIDTTGSMDTYINGVKDRAIEFSNILADKGCVFKLGLIGFGDLGEKEKPSVYNFTDDVTRFQKQVKNIPRTYGGDIPESSLEALETGVQLLESARVDPGSKNIFILITDAPPHVPTYDGKSVRDICNILASRDVTTYVVARKDRESIDAYDPLTKPSGKYYDLNDKFYDILDNIAISIAELIRL